MPTSLHLSLSYPSGEVDDVGWFVLFEDGLGGLHVPQVAVFAAQEHVLLVLLGLRATGDDMGEARRSAKFRGDFNCKTPTKE